ncbi:MAG: DNA repair protein RecO [Nitrospinota bacterium]
MAFYRSDALVLRRFTLGEADRLVVFLTRDRGKVRAVARSAQRARSRFAGALEPLTHIHLEYYGRENAEVFRANSVDVLRSFDRLRQDYDKLKGALVLAELLDRLLEDGAEQPALFDLALGVLERMEAKDSIEDPLILFEIRFLRELGYQPNLDRCGRCGKNLAEKGAVYRAGVAELTCRSCSSGGIRLSPGGVKHLIAVSSLPLPRAFQVSAMRPVQGEVQRFLHAFLTGVSGARLKSLRFLNS